MKSYSSKIFALVDCNNFFVSCERIFRPELEGKPVVVLSSNDGCVVARSNEAKSLGIPMGAPAFQYRQLFQARKVVQFSANFELYGDISRRIVSILSNVTPRTEIYSVDESFLDISQLAITDYTRWGRALREDILRAVSVPVSIGIAPTKTLAKLGADHAKKDAALSGVLDLATLDSAERARHLEHFPLEDVWGVGRHLGPRLRAEGIHTALALSRMRPAHARQLMGLRGAQMVDELNGLSCLELTPFHSPPKSIMRSRTFGEDTHERQVVEAAVASLAARAALEARHERCLARKALLHVSSNRHKPGYTAWYEEMSFAAPTYDSGHIISALLGRLGQIYQRHQAYHRAGVTLYDFVPAEVMQTDLFEPMRAAAYDAERARMQAIDAINARFGRHRIHYAAEDLSATWQPKRLLRSPRYVSHWSELPEVYIQ